MSLWRRRRIGSCSSCGYLAFAYDLNVKIDKEIILFLEEFGKPVLPFERTSFLKISGPACFITGVKQLKEVKLTLKRAKDAAEIVPKFEKSLSKWIKSKLG